MKVAKFRILNLPHTRSAEFLKIGLSEVAQTFKYSLLYQTSKPTWVQMYVTSPWANPNTRKYLKNAKFRILNLPHTRSAEFLKIGLSEVAQNFKYSLLYQTSIPTWVQISVTSPWAKSNTRKYLESGEM